MAVGLNIASDFRCWDFNCAYRTNLIIVNSEMVLGLNIASDLRCWDFNSDPLVFRRSFITEAT